MWRSIPTPATNLLKDFMPTNKINLPGYHIEEIRYGTVRYLVEFNDTAYDTETWVKAHHLIDIDENMYVSEQPKLKLQVIGPIKIVSFKTHDFDEILDEKELECLFIAQDDLIYHKCFDMHDAIDVTAFFETNYISKINGNYQYMAGGFAYEIELSIDWT